MTTSIDPTGAPRRFAFLFEGLWRWGVLPWGVTPGRAWAEIDDRQIRVRFGPWHVDSPLENVARYELQPPYRWWRALGVRMTLGKWDVSFCSSSRNGIYLEFKHPQRLWGSGHPAFTMTLADPVGFVEELRSRGIAGGDVRSPFPAAG